MTVSVFSVPVFFVIFRETVEVGIIVSVLLAFLKQTLDGPSRDVVVYNKLRRQVRPASPPSPFPSSPPPPLSLSLHISLSLPLALQLSSRKFEQILNEFDELEQI